MPGCNSDDQNTLVYRARKMISTYEDMAELIRLGAYRRGSNPEVDEAMYYYPRIEEFMRQNKGDHTDLDGCYALLAEVLKPQPIQIAEPALTKSGAQAQQQRSPAMPTMRSGGVKPQTITAR